MSELGFTFYPKDWWASDSFFDLTPLQRYYYLECLFLMYLEKGCIKTQKTQIEKRLQTQISDEDWNEITQKFEIIDGKYTHKSVNKRLRKTLANRENGKKGGRPKKNPENPEKNPPLENKVNIIENKSKEILPPSATRTLEIRKKDFYDSLSQYVTEYGKQTVREFFDYWTEPTNSGKKMKFELERTWDSKLRLNTWRRNGDKFSDKKDQPKTFNAQEFGLNL